MLPNVVVASQTLDPGNGSSDDSSGLGNEACRTKTETSRKPCQTGRCSELCRFSWRKFCAFWRDTWDDLKSIRNHDFPNILYYHILPIFAMLSSVIAIVLMGTKRTIGSAGSFCSPDGSVNLSKNDYNPWAISELFTINIGFGKLAFAQVKIIDIIWDVVVGRGGQALLAVSSYGIVTSSLTRVMESQPVSYGVFEATALQDNSLKTFWKLSKDFMKNEGLRAKAIMFAILLSVVASLAFPTLAAAMTGYSANFDAMITLNETSIPASRLQNVWYVIHDGSRLGPGFYDDYPVLDHSDNYVTLDDGPHTKPVLHKSALEWETSRHTWMYDCSRFAPGQVNFANESITMKQYLQSVDDTNCNLLWQISNYTYTYGLLGQNNSDSNFYDTNRQKNIDLKGSILNISMWMPYTLYRYNDSVSNLFRDNDLAWTIMPYGVSWYYDHTGSFPSWRNLFAFENTTDAELFDVSSILSRTTCHQQGPGSQDAIQYQWGFSYQLLVLCFVSLLIWGITMYAVHIDAILVSKLYANRRELGPHRAMLDITPKYQEDIVDQDTKMTGDKELKKSCQGGTISYQSLIADTSVPTGYERLKVWWKAFSIKKWAQDEWLWILLLLLCISLEISSSISFYHLGNAELGNRDSRIFYVWDPDFGLLPIIGLATVLFIGRSHPSRWIVLFLTAVPFVVVHAIWVAGAVMLS